MADLIYNSARAAIFGDTDLSGTPVDLDSDTIKLALFTSSHTPSATAIYFSNLTNEVAATGGYAAGGTALASKTVAYSGGTATFDAADVTWSSSTITARYGVVYKSTGVDATSPLLALFDFGSDKISSSGDFTVAWSASGIFTLA